MLQALQFVKAQTVLSSAARLWAESFPALQECGRSVWPVLGPDPAPRIPAASSWCFTGGLQTPPTDFLTRNSCSSTAQQIAVGWHWQSCQAAVNSHIHIRSGLSLLRAEGLRMHLSGMAPFLYRCISSLPARAQHNSWFVAMPLAPPKPRNSSF